MQANVPTVESVNTYVRSLKDFPRITRDRESILADKIQHGNASEREEAIHELVTSNLRLVLKVAHDLKYCGLGFQDLVAEGNIGLITAAKKFDPSKCPKFGAYATYWVKQAMRVAITKHSRLIRLPAQAAGQLYTLNKLREEYILTHDKEPTEKELSALSGISELNIHNTLNAAVRTFSLDEKVKEDEDTTFGDLVCLNTEDPQNNNHEDMLIEALRQHIDELSDRAKTALTLYFGLAKKAHAPRVVAQEIGYSMRQAEEFINAQLCKLKKSLMAEGLTL